MLQPNRDNYTVLDTIHTINLMLGGAILEAQYNKDLKRETELNGTRITLTEYRREFLNSINETDNS